MVTRWVVSDVEHPGRDAFAPELILLEPGNLLEDLGLPLLGKTHADSIFMELRDLGDSKGVLRALVVGLDHTLRQVQELKREVQSSSGSCVRPNLVYFGGKGTVAIAKVLGPVGALGHIASTSAFNFMRSLHRLEIGVPLPTSLILKQVTISMGLMEPLKSEGMGERKKN